MRRVLGRLFRLGLKVVAIGLAALLLGIALLLAAMRLDRGMAVELPRPSGPFPVGRIATAWTDSARSDPFAPAPAPRELAVWIWYPARATDASRPAPYLPEAWRRALDEHGGILLSRFVWRAADQVRGHSLDDAALAPDSAAWPVVVFRSGIGALALDYSTLVEDLASHGYIVVGADAPYSTTIVVLPDGRVIHKTDAGNPGDAPMAESARDSLLERLVGVWTADTRFLLDRLARLDAGDPAGRFTGRIALDAVGIAGHSFGGATAAQACHDDPRCRAGIDLDGAPYGGVTRESLAQPFLFLLADHRAEWRTPTCAICRDIRSAASRAPENKLIVMLDGADHFTFSDDPVEGSRVARAVIGLLGGASAGEARRGLANAVRYVREFFDVHLRGSPRQALYTGPLMPGARFAER